MQDRSEVVIHLTRNPRPRLPEGRSTLGTDWLVIVLAQLLSFTDPPLSPRDPVYCGVGGGELMSTAIADFKKNMQP